MGLTKNGFEKENNSNPKINMNELEHIIKFIKTYLIQISYFNSKHSSYGIKHIVERCIGGYVSNGELIAAMLFCGYRYKIYNNGLNCYFNVGNINERKIKNLINLKNKKNENKRTTFTL